jgi:Asp-tRNA(Asn)/Glu-tRNA(Gln) amidotransferase A subunit family amidase
MDESDSKATGRSVRQASALQRWEHHIRSFVELCPQPTSSAAKPDDQGVLTNIKVGVKDIIDVQGMPTRNGSATYRDAKPAVEDATVVASLRRAGASIIGKTTTTEFAFTDPTDCCNPYDLKRSPGGSSSGSGAAVAAGIVDMALGTQTAGSLCRPAAYCGVVGLKPTFGVLPTDGVTPLAVSFDTVGIIASSVDIARKSLIIMAGPTPFQNSNEPKRNEFRVARALLPTETVATTETLSAFHDATTAIGNVLNPRSTSIKELNIKANVADIVSAHRTVMNAEAAQSHSLLLQSNRVNLLRPNFRAGLEAGSKVSATELEDARGLLLLAKEEFWLQLAGVDIVLTLAVPDAAPLMDGTTGFQDWLTPWTVFGGPLVCLPWGMDSLGRPKSIMLAATPGQDLRLLAMAKRLEPLAPFLPPPSAPSDNCSA